MTTLPQPRVFISAASTEFGPLRQKLAHLLLRSGISVEYQDLFPQTTSDTVYKLGDLIRPCALLVHILGRDPGSIAHPAAVADLLERIPADQFLSRFPDLRRQLDDCSGLTYTQWEAFLALHYGVPTLVYAASDPGASGTQTLSDPSAQKTHHERLRAARKRVDFCDDEADFIGKILADVHRHFGIVPPVDKPRNLPYTSLGSLFKGRADFLARVHALAQDNATVIRGRQVIHGMGGVGKTRAAVEYALEHADDYRALLFVTADSPESLERNLAALCSPLVLNLPEQEARETELQVSAVRRWLNRNPGWFLIIDNVDTFEAQRAVATLLSAIPEGHVVVTSRLADWPGGVTALDLDVLSEESAIAFLLERTEDRRIRRGDDALAAAQIVRMLDCLALALEQSAAYVRHRRCAFADYLADWEGKRVAVLGWHDANKSYYPRSLAITYDTTVAQLSDDARELFRMLSWMAPEPIPMWAIEKIASISDPRTRLVELADLHLARLSPDGTTCSVHRLLQEITRQQETGAQPQSLIAALKWVNGEYPSDSDDVRFWPVAIPLTAHAIAVGSLAADHEISQPSARLLDEVARLHVSKANYRVAEPLMRRALSIAETEFGDSHYSVGTCLNNLAEVLRDTNRLGEAEALMRRSLAISEAVHGDCHPVVAGRLSNLARVLQATDRLGEAEALMRRALAIDEASLDDLHPSVATHLNNFATLLQMTDRSVEAEPLIRRALAINEASYADSHPRVAECLNNLARVMQSTDRPGEAELLMRRALAISEASYGDWHPAVSTNLANLAQLLRAIARPIEAEPLMRRALAIDEASLGESHPRVARGLNNLAQLLQEARRFDEAEPLMRQVLAVDESIHGDSHPDVARDLSNLADLLQQTDRVNESEPLMRRTVEILMRSTRNTGHQHPNLDAVLDNYSRVLVTMGDTQVQALEKMHAIWASLG